MALVKVKDFLVGEGQPLTIICGPCVIESETQAKEAAEFLMTLMQELGLQFIYKSSYDKANRSSYQSFRGPGVKKGLQILDRIRREFDVPVLTDVHTPQEAVMASEVCDVIQIPAFLSRQTDLITTAGQTGSVVNVKKGQFMAPGDMQNVVDKLRATGNEKIILTDRGTSFGYNNLVSDMRAIPIMKEMGYPVCYDASHSVMFPGGNGTSSGGQRKFIPTLSKAAVAAGCDLVFIEAHPNPQEAKSDKETVYPFSELKELLIDLQRIYGAVHV
ncbi:MAG: 3-deoxy-8-phosphooctulonate synthase [Rhabdochlamydiaceae bacterium]|nr:3-deoxy-8-phosphooctulonate synthase [Rhabdochlamydiaceae bacterium]